MLSLSIKLNDVLLMMWYTYTGKVNRKLPHKRRPAILEPKDVIGFRKLKNKTYHLVFPDAAQKQYVLSEADGDRLMKYLEQAPMPDIVLNDGKVIAQDKVVPVAKLKQKATALDNPRFRMSVQPKDEAKKIIFKNFQWRVANIDQPIKVKRGHGRNASTMELFFEEGTVFGVRFERRGGGWLVNTDGMRTSMSEKQYDRLVKNSKLIPINQIPKGGAKTIKMSEFTKAIEDEELTKLREEKALIDAKEKERKDRERDERKQAREESRKRQAELEANEAVYKAKELAQRRATLKNISPEQHIKEQKRLEQAKRQSNLVDEALLEDLGALGEGLDDVLNLDKIEDAPIFNKKAVTLVEPDKEPEEKDEDDDMDEDEDTDLLDKGLDEMLNALREESRKVDEPKDEEELPDDTGSDDNDSSDTDDSDTNPANENSGDDDVEEDADEGEGEDTDSEEEVDGQSEDEEEDEDDEEDEEDSIEDDEEDEVEVVEEDINDEGTEADEDAEVAEKAKPKKAKVKDIKSYDPQVMEVLSFKKDDQDRDFVVMNIEEKKDGNILVYTLYDITTAPDGFYVRRVAAKKKSAFTSSVEFVRKMTEKKFNSLASEVEDMERLKEAIIS